MSTARHNFSSEKKLIPSVVAAGGVVGFVALMAILSETPASYDPHSPGIVIEVQETPRKIDDFYINGVYMGSTRMPFVLLEQCETIDTTRQCVSESFPLPNTYNPGSIAVGDTIVAAADLAG